MPRTLSTAVKNEIAAGKMKPVFLVQIGFTTGTAYLWSGTGNLVWNGHTWTGVYGPLPNGNPLGTISAMTEGNNVQAYGVKLGLSALNTSLIAAALTQVQQGQPCIIWLGFLTDAGVVIADPAEAWRGKVDVPTINEDPANPSITLTIEQRMVALKNGEPRRYTDQDQKLIDPTDLGFQYVPQLQSFNLVWGPMPGGTASGSSGSGNSGAWGIYAQPKNN